MHHPTDRITTSSNTIVEHWREQKIAHAYVFVSHTSLMLLDGVLYNKVVFCSNSLLKISATTVSQCQNIKLPECHLMKFVINHLTFF